VVLTLHYWWVVRMDVRFEEASLEAAQKRADVIAAMRSGNVRLFSTSKKRNKPFFALQPLGPRVMALFWKNLIVAGQAFSFRFWLGVVVVGVVFAGVFGNRPGMWEVVQPVAAGMCLMGFVFSLLMGPQVMRHDLRQDLQVADVLKQYPLAGWQIVLGELLAPTMILTLMQWIFLAIILLFSGQMPKDIPVDLRFAVVIAAAVLVPGLNFLGLLIPNAAVLVFPSWFNQSGESQQGMEATGQRLIMMFLQVFVLLLSMVPAAGVFTVVFFLITVFLGAGIAIPIAAVCALIVLAAEATAGIVFLGKLFERLDLSLES
jgi:ABC-2 type transport system permease protein